MHDDQAQAEVQSLIQQGYGLLLGGRPKEAVEIFERAREVAGFVTKEIAGGIGVALQFQQRAAEAIPLLELAISQGFAPGEVRVAHVLALNRTGRHREGLVSSEKYLTLMKRSPAALFFHSEQLMRVGRLKDGASMMSEALSQDDRLRDQNIDRLLAAWIASENYAAATPVLFQILRRRPGSEKFHNLLTHCLEMTEFASRAVAIARGEEATAGAVEYFQAAVFLDRANALEDAMRALDKCRALQPDLLLVKSLTARIMLRSGRTIEAAALQKEIWAETAGSMGDSSTGSEPVAALAPNRPIGPIVYLPVELEGRELLSRLLLAIEILKQGYIPVILSYALFKGRSDVLPQGIIVYKSYNGIDNKLLSALYKAGNIVTVIDEEAFGWTGDANVMRRSAEIKNLAYCTAIFAPGEAYVEALRPVVHDADKVLIPTGNPRIDFYRADLRHVIIEEAQVLRKTLGPHVLLCTNFGGWNAAALSYGAVCKSAFTASGWSNDARGKWGCEVFMDAAEAECRGFQAVLEAVDDLGREVPDLKLVMRPHPAEDSATWRNTLQHCANVTVIEGGSLAAHMEAADAVIHLPGCGTGLEAWLLRRPSISLDLAPGLKYPRFGLSSQTSAKANSIPELVALVRRACEAPDEMIAQAQEKAELVRQHVPFDAERVSTRIASHLAQLLASATSQPSYAEVRRTAGDVANALKVLHAEAKVRPSVNIRRDRSKRITARGADVNRILGTIDSTFADKVRIDSPVEGAFILTLK
jgi:surface carbohydrate biosynthesis protein